MASTIRDVAKYAGVGVGTVSRVLNDHPAVREVTREKVLDAIEALNYTPNLAARRLSSGRTLTIGIIAPFFTKPSYVERLRGVESVLAETEYDMVLYNVETVERRDRYFREISSQERVDGLLIMSLSPSDTNVKRFEEAGVTTLLVDAYHPDLTHIVIDNFKGGAQATRYLIDLGHRKIGYISTYLENPFYFTPMRDRLLGYQKALKEAGIEFRPEYHLEGLDSREEARRMAYEMLSLPDPPTAIFAFSDIQAIGVLEAARHLGLDVPKDLSVVGFDDIDAAEYVQLTTIKQSLFESGLVGTKRLLRMLETEAGSPRSILLPTQLIVRSTSGPPPH